MRKQRANGRCACLKYTHTLFYTGWQGKPSLVSLEKKCMGGRCFEMCAKNSARRGNTEAKSWSRTLNRGARGWKSPTQGHQGSRRRGHLDPQASLGFFQLWRGDH